MHPVASVWSAWSPAGYIIPHWVHLKLADVLDPVDVSFRLGVLPLGFTFYPSPKSRDDHGRLAL